MDINDVISEVQDHGFQGTPAARILSFANQVYHELCATPYPFLIKSNTFTNNSGDNSINPTESSGTVRAIRSLVDTGNDITLMPVRSEVLRKSYTSDLSETGGPVYYYFDGNTPKLYPVPDSTYTFSIEYTVRPNDLNTTSNTTGLIPSDYMYLLVPGILAKLNAMNEDTDLSVYFREQFLTQIAAVQEMLWMQQYDRNDVIADITDDPSWFSWGV